MERLDPKDQKGFLGLTQVECINSKSNMSLGGYEPILRHPK